MNELLKIFKALSDPTRLRILRMLNVKPLCVCEVMHVLGMAQSTTSKHLQILLDAGLLEAGHGGVWTIYSIIAAPKLPVISQVLDSIKNSKDTDKTKTDISAARKADRNRLCRQKKKKA